jgi:hypothetical protein
MAASQVIETCRDLAGIGIQHAIFNMPNVHDIVPLEVFGREIIPACRTLIPITGNSGPDPAGRGWTRRRRR